MNPEETREYAEGWNDIAGLLSEADDNDLIDLYRINKRQAAHEQPANQYFWGGFEHIEGMMYARGLMDEFE